MEKLYNFVSESLNNYFNTLEENGYLKQLDVFRIFIAVLLSKFIEDYKEYIEDYYTIQKAMDCLTENSCLLSNNSCDICKVC